MFTPATFDFLRELRANNDKAWFEANRKRWEADAKAPMLAFIRAFRPHLAALSAHYVADDRPVGGSMFRIHRDTRFSKDKSPYKPYLSAQFRHEAAKGGLSEAVHAPGFYLHVAPDGAGEMEGVFVGFGMWHPEPKHLAAIRARMVAAPDEWRAATAGLSRRGDTLRRVPTGFAADHPLAEDLRRRDHIAIVNFTEADAVRTDFVARVAAACASGAAWQRFLCTAVGLAF